MASPARGSRYPRANDTPRRRREPFVLHNAAKYRAGRGWDAPLPAEMDGPQTLVLAFAASEFARNPAPFAELAAAFPQSLLVGCSTSGEIAGTQVSDASVSVAVARFH